MRTSRRAIVWIAILGFAIALVTLLLQQHSDEPLVAEIVASSPQSIEAMRPMPIAPGTTSGEMSAASSTGPADEAVTQCVQTISDATNFVTKESNAANPVRASDADSDQLLAELAAAQRQLAGSGDPEHFLVAMLLDSVPEPRASNDAAAQANMLDLGDRALRSGSKLLAWHALRACAAAKQSCPIAHLEQRLLATDQQNSEAWALVATLRYERGDFAGSLAAMQGAARAPTSTWYWTETIALIERSLASQTAMPYAQRMGNAIGAGASASPPLSSLFNTCKAESASSRAWTESCLAFGKLRADRNETDLARSTAHSLRERVLTTLGDREGAAEAAADLAFVRAERSAMGQEPAMSMQLLQWEVIGTDPARMHAYLGAVQQFGELEGRRVFLRQELPPLLQRAGLLRRDGARECIAQFFGPRRVAAGQQAQVGDVLYISMNDSPSRPSPVTVRIRPDGKITLPWIPRNKAAAGTAVQSERDIEVAGRTADQLQREIAKVVPGRHPSSLVLVSIFSPGSREDLQLEFDSALREAAKRRSNLH
jgi:hypothetical protein